MSLPAGVCISSILMSGDASNFYDIFVLHSNEEPAIYGLESILKTFHNVRIQYRSVGDAFLGAYEVRGITNAAYFRLLAPKLITEYDKAIYADVDTLFRLDLESLLERDMGDNYLGAVYALEMNINPERTLLLKEITSDYDITIVFKNGETITSIYREGFMVLPKTNGLDIYDETQFQNKY